MSKARIYEEPILIIPCKTFDIIKHFHPEICFIEQEKQKEIIMYSHIVCQGHGKMERKWGNYLGETGSVLNYNWHDLICIPSIHHGDQHLMELNFPETEGSKTEKKENANWTHHSMDYPKRVKIFHIVGNRSYLPCIIGCIEKKEWSLNVVDQVLREEALGKSKQISFFNIISRTKSDSWD